MKRIDPLFTADVDDQGRIHIRDPGRFRKWMMTLRGEVAELSVKKRRRKRSTQQNRYYWGVVIEVLREHFGYTPDEMHEALKWHFLKLKHAKLPTVRSTSDMSVAEFTDFIENVKVWAAQEFDIQVPDPDQIDI